MASLVLINLFFTLSPFTTIILFCTEEGVEGGTIQRPYSMADFELIRVIGRGSYAKVLMVELRRTRRVYAMKVIKKELVTDDEVLFTLFINF